MNVVLIGLGGIGMQYDLGFPGRVQTHARALQSLEPLNWYAVDPDENVRCEFECHYDGRTVSDLGGLPQGVRWDLIVIASPTDRHELDLDWACEQSPSLILLEKPVTASESELARIESRVSQSGCKIMVNLIRNYEPTTQRWLGRIPSTGQVTVQVNYAKGLIHNGIHFLTLLMHAFGPIDRIEALTRSPDRPVVRVDMGRVTAFFIPNDADSALNGMSIRQGAAEWTWVQGGRYLLEVTPEITSLQFNEEFHRYQHHVLAQAKKIIGGAPDDSFRLAVDAQRHLQTVLKQEQSS